MTDPCRVLLLRLLDDMNVNGVVSIPRSRLSADLGIPPARVSERVKQAREIGLLTVVRYGAPGVTAVYQASLPDSMRGTSDVPTTGLVEVRPPVPSGGTSDVPQSGGLEVRQTGTHCVETSAHIGDLSEWATSQREQRGEAECSPDCSGPGCLWCEEMATDA
jgi:hypothetical protein